MIFTTCKLEEAWVIFSLKDDLICKMVRLAIVCQVKVTFRDSDLLVLIDHDYLQCGLKSVQQASIISSL